RRGEKLWALNPDQLLITTKVKAVTCDGYRPMHVPASQADFWVGLPALSAASLAQCYVHVESVRPTLYQRLYRHGEVHRVIAHEHTGLLLPEERIRVENSFIKGSN